MLGKIHLLLFSVVFCHFLVSNLIFNSLEIREVHHISLWLTQLFSKYAHFVMSQRERPHRNLSQVLAPPLEMLQGRLPTM